MKLCSKCGEKNDRLPQRYCKSCHAEYMRNHRPKYSELSEEERKKDICRSYANVYQRRGRLHVEPCCICGAKAEKHHGDYSKPLELIWLCRKHHLAVHKELHGPLVSPN